MGLPHAPVTPLTRDPVWSNPKIPIVHSSGASRPSGGRTRSPTAFRGLRRLGLPLLSNKRHRCPPVAFIPRPRETITFRPN